MNEPRYINANELKDTLDYYITEAGWSASHNEALTWVKDEFIDAVKTADVAPVVHGRWEVVYNSVGKQEGQCTHCGKNSGILITKKSYCPNCGAKMDEEEPNNEH